MKNKCEILKAIADKYGSLIVTGELNYRIESAYYNDINVVLELSNAGLSFKRIKSKDCETFYYLID